MGKPRSRSALPIALSLGAVLAIVGINAMASKNTPAPVDVSSPEQRPEREAPRVQPSYEKRPQDAHKYVRELARRSQGNFKSLNADDQRFLNGMTAGHGKDMLQSNWDAISREQTSAKAPTKR